MTDPYSTTPPTEACHLWMKGPVGSTSCTEYVCHFSPNDGIDPRYLFGPRIPTAAELHRAAECQTALLAKLAAAEAKVRELERIERLLRDGDFDRGEEMCVPIHVAAGRDSAAQDSPEDSE